MNCFLRFTRRNLLACIVLSLPCAAPSLYADTPLYDGKKPIGAIAEITLPQLGLKRVKTKVDTGARTSSLHCSRITVDASKQWVEFVPLEENRSFRMRLTRIAKVKSSNAAAQLRPFVSLQVCLGADRYEAEFSLTDRSGMKYPVLLGREFLKGRFVVDVAR